MLRRILGAITAGSLVCACSPSSDGSGADGTSSTTSGGTGTGEPTLVVEQIVQTAINKIDVLFVVDNSSGMADKQALLSQAVPGLVERLVNPDCVQTDDDGNVFARQPAGADAGNPCPEGFDTEFRPVDDIHIGVITSSLGGHGGDLCSPNADNWNETQNDLGHLLSTVRPDLDLPTDDPAGFLAWNGSGKDQLQADFAQHVLAAGDVGCGYEAPLEAWYRFLVDPSPPLEMVVTDGRAAPAQNTEGSVLIDAALLQQRQAFLRPDSAVVIAMLSDENDCSIVDSGIGWMATQSAVLAPSTSACDEDPNDPCCSSCGLPAPSGCPDVSEDASCSADPPEASDPLSLRCYNQKQRFGFDLLYPISRYVDALKNAQVYDNHRCDEEGTCPLVQNPLFDPRGASSVRDAGVIYLAGIVGVPWQDIATAESLADPSRLEFMNAEELADGQRWDLVVGHPEAENPSLDEYLPRDPLMIEQTEPRTGTHPITAEVIDLATSDHPIANSINSHEFVNVDGSELQYACIFPLAEPRDCAEASESCDCTEADLAKNSPLCHPAEGGEVGTTQYFAKAYPAPRLLHTLRDFGDNAIVGSVCPKVTTLESAHPAYGYNPAIAAVVDRVKESLGGRCFERVFRVDAESRIIGCSVVEATLHQLPCDPAEGRSDVDAELAAAVRQGLEESGSCGGATGVPCDNYFQCQVNQLSGSDHQECLNTFDYAGSPGFCHIDADLDVGNPALLVGCPVTNPRKLRFVGEDTPRPDSITFTVCDPPSDEAEE